jgi:hypothetical protein
MMVTRLVRWKELWRVFVSDRRAEEKNRSHMMSNQQMVVLVSYILR